VDADAVGAAVVVDAAACGGITGVSLIVTECASV